MKQSPRNGCGSRAAVAALALLVVSACPAVAQTPPLFTDVTATAGVAFLHQNVIDPENMAFGTGAAWLDYDRDGDLDLYVTQGLGPNRLFENRGDGTFTDVAADRGAADAGHRGGGLAVADFDNDGWPDLFLANADEDVLLRNVGGAFLDVTPGSGLEAGGDARSTGAAWGDYDGDGFLDLYVSNHLHLAGDGYDHHDYFYHNNGDGTFTDVSDLLGRDRLDGHGFAATWTDYDDDGDPDLLVINDCTCCESTQTNLLFRNDGGHDPLLWTFTEVTEQAGVAQCEAAMGVAPGDFDRDGRIDYFYTDIGWNHLMHNLGGAFTDVAETATARIAATNDKKTWTWGANFFDYDLDGWLDLYVTAGTLLRHTDPAADPQRNVLLHHDGPALTFTDVSADSGTDDFKRGRTSIAGDYDGDGDGDLFLVNSDGPAYLFRNDQAAGNHYLIVDLQGTVSNRDGIGARLTLTTPDGVVRTAETRSGSSHGGGDDRAAYFGLGPNTTVATLEIRWPSGTRQTLTGLAADQRLSVTETAGTATAAAADDGPGATALLGAYPVPSTGATYVDYRLDRPLPVRLEAFDLLGRRVTVLDGGVQPAGRHRLVWDGPAAAGVYLLRLRLGDRLATTTVLRR